MASANQTARRQGLFILGMHRSGTSALTRVVSLLGAALPSRLMPALPGINEQGFWESEELAGINDEILAAAGSSWDDLSEVSPSWYGSALARHYERRAVDFLEREFARSPLFVVKDPRLCRLAPFWLSACERFGADPRFVLVLRNPLEVAASLKKRGDVPASKAMVLWLRYALDAERGTRVARRTIVSYGALLHDWRAVAAKVAKDLGVTWPRGVEEAAGEIGAFLSDRHRHHRTTLAQLETRSDVSSWIPRIYARALEAGETGDDGPLARELDALRAAFAAALETLGPTLADAEDRSGAFERRVAARERELADRQEALAQAGRELADERLRGDRLHARLGEREADLQRLERRLALAEAELAAVLATRSWRMTAPFRRLVRLLRPAPGPSGLAPEDAAGVEPAPDGGAEAAESANAVLRELRPLFDTCYYLRSYPDVRRTGMDPLAHYLSSGAVEGRKIHHRFDGAKAMAAVASGKEMTSDLLRSCALEFRDDEELYEHLAEELRLLKEIRDLEFTPRPPPVIELATENEAVAALGELSVPAAAEPVVSIVIPVYNQLKLTAECLLSLARHTDLNRHEVVVVDDASEDFLPEVLGAVSGVQYLRNEVNVGFLESCLRGARAATGGYLLLLNNDTQATPGWLEALLETFDRGDDVGASGPKLVFPDGCLQEAGAAVAPDGSSILIGLNGDPESPRYDYPREVDYCSGACLLVRRSSWDAVGGFDPRYSPAYCEDVDLCFRLRQAGHKTIYNPRAMVIHRLSQTSAEISGSYKRAQVARNRRILMETWAEEIERRNAVRLIVLGSSEEDAARLAELIRAAPSSRLRQAIETRVGDVGPAGLEPRGLEPPGCEPGEDAVGREEEYERAMLHAVSGEPPGPGTYRAVPAWSGRAALPAAFRLWLESAVEDVRRLKPPDDRVVFIDARRGRGTIPRSPAARPPAR
ncbi:MAG TPA: glycosyltransferase [Thermoanaerobaculia bacterium]